MPRLDIETPRYDQSTFLGRARHFFITTNPLNVLASDAQLDRAKAIVESYRAGKEDKALTEEQIWEVTAPGICDGFVISSLPLPQAKQLYDSAFHPQTGEKLFILGRMSFQVPGNMCITGCMMTFYRSTPAVIFWQWANQSFNAIVNYTNRNASVGVSNEQLGQAYFAATSASVLTALGFNKLIASSPRLSAGLIGRFVPPIAYDCATESVRKSVRHAIQLRHAAGACRSSLPRPRSRNTKRPAFMQHAAHRAHHTYATCTMQRVIMQRVGHRIQHATMQHTDATCAMQHAAHRCIMQYVRHRIQALTQPCNIPTYQEMQHATCVQYSMPYHKCNMRHVRYCTQHPTTQNAGLCRSSRWRQPTALTYR
jgi:hypothetical protein